MLASTSMLQSVNCLNVRYCQLNRPPYRSCSFHIPLWQMLLFGFLSLPYTVSCPFLQILSDFRFWQRLHDWPIKVCDLHIFTRWYYIAFCDRFCQIDCSDGFKLTYLTNLIQHPVQMLSDLSASLTYNGLPGKCHQNDVSNWHMLLDRPPC